MNVDSTVLEIVLTWARNLARHRTPRVNARLLLGDTALANAVREALEANHDLGTWFLVRRSADTDAVKLRHGRPGSPPVGLPPDAPIVYIVFWLPAVPGHELNEQSLRDIPAHTTAELLQCSDAHADLELERAMLGRIDDATKAWPGKEQERSRDQYRTAWSALRKVLREERGGRERSVPFVGRLQAYSAWLNAAMVPAQEWNDLPADKRPARLVAAWGDALAELGLFRVPALASLLGLTTEPGKSLARAGTTQKWFPTIADLLAENFDASADFSNLADLLAGTASVKRQLERHKRIPLTQDKSQEALAREKLEEFCQSGDPDALRLVEWAFLEDPANRRSTTFGLQGLLSERRSGRRRMNPLDRAAEETTECLLRGLSGDAVAQEAAAKEVEQMKVRASRDLEEASSIAEALRALGDGTVMAPLAASPSRAVFDRIAQSPQRDIKALRAVADSWSALADKRPARDEVLEADTVLLGVARVVAQALGRDDAQKPEAKLPSSKIRVSAESDDVKPFDWDLASADDGTVEQLRRWLRDVVLPSTKDQDEAEEEDPVDAEADIESLAFTVTCPNGAKMESLGRFQVSWSHSLADSLQKYTSIAGRVLDTSTPCAPRPSLATLLLPENERATATEPAFNALLGELKLGEPGAADAWLIGPCPSAGAAWVEASFGSLEWVRRASGAGTASISDLEAQRDRAIDAGDVAVARRLKDEIAKAKASAPPPLPPIEEVRKRLQLCTAAWMGPDGRHVLLLPQHPLVLRLRIASERLLVTLVQHVGNNGWPGRALGDLERVLSEWRLPEPMRFYGWEGEPAEFREWDGLIGPVLFGPQTQMSQRESERLGQAEAERILDRYCRLFPARTDNLALRISADGEGNWARCFASGHLPDSGRASIDVVPKDGTGEALERRLRLDDDVTEAFALHDDGLPPRVRLRAAEGEVPVHIAFAAGEVFRPSIERDPIIPTPITRALFEPSVLFGTSEPRLGSIAVEIGDPLDEYCLRVAAAVGFARDERVGRHVHRYTFDTPKVTPEVERLHRNAHWLALVSRHPLHRAVQAARDVAALLDFRTTWQDGRPMYACVSISRDQIARDLGRLNVLAAQIVGEPIERLGQAIIDHARTFVPGRAINCAGAVSALEVQGLLGLLLSERAIARAHTHPTLLLPIDQHQGLLARSTRGRSGPNRRADLLVLQARPTELALGVVECKLSGDKLDKTHPMVVGAHQQVASSMEALERLTLAHPLAMAVRWELIAAVYDLLELNVDKREAALFDRVLAAVRGQLPVVADAALCGVRAWSLHKDTVSVDETVGGHELHIASKNETLQAIRTLAGA